jgi:hypothetical protein
MQLTRDEMRAKIEEALRALAPGPYQRLEDGDVFLTLASPAGALIYYLCDNSIAHLEYGPGGSDISEFNTTDDDGKDAFTEDDLKHILKAMVQSTLDIQSERVFAASYKKLFGTVAGLYPAAEFESMRNKKGFASQSWNGTFNLNLSATNS